MSQYRKVNNLVLKPDHIGVGVQRNKNEPGKRMENVPIPIGALLVNPHLVYQPPNLVERNDIINFIHEVCCPLTLEVPTPVYRKPYPERIERIKLPRGFKFTTFSLFTSDGSQSTVEHIAKFTSQCAEAGTNKFLKLRLFANSLTDIAFTWFINLAPNFVHNWAQMEDLFYAQVF